MARERLSAVVTTFNNAATLERCLASIAFADDLVVLDSGSTDATVEIAAKHEAHFYRAVQGLQCAKTVGNR